MKSIAIATEDELSEEIAVRLVSDAALRISMKLRKGGSGYLRGSIEKFANMALHQPLLIITDLDAVLSPARLISQWFGKTQHPPNLFFHVAVREVEAWILADHAGMNNLLGQKIGKLPAAPETLPDPKASLLGLAGKAPRSIRSELVAERNSIACQGLGYNATLCAFVESIWQPKFAAMRSPSLAALMTELAVFSKT